jgi:hypothetical protein
MSAPNQVIIIRYIRMVIIALSRLPISAIVLSLLFYGPVERDRELLHSRLTAPLGSVVVTVEKVVVVERRFLLDCAGVDVHIGIQLRDTLYSDSGKPKSVFVIRVFKIAV